MPIVVRHLAKIDLRGVSVDTKSLILGLYSYSNKYTGESFTNYIYKDGICYLPPNMEKLQMVASLLDETIVDERSKGAPLNSPFVLQEGFKLRDYQVAPAEELINHAKEFQYSTLFAGTGLGKSMVLTYVAGSLGGRYLVCIDQNNLLPSWKEAAKSVWGRELQQLQSTTTEFSDTSICSFQLLARNEQLLNRIRKVYSTGLIDECHVSAAPTYKKVLSRLDNYYRLACTASFLKKGFTSEVLTDFLAPISVTMKSENPVIPNIRWVNTGVKWASEQPYDYATCILPYLAADEKRNELVMSLIEECVRDNRITIVMAITVAQAKYLSNEASKIGAKAISYTGATSVKKDNEVRNMIDTGKLNVITCVSKVLKGVDWPKADAMILVKPHNSEKDAIQGTGRVTRKVEGKPTPIIYDLRDIGPLAETFARNRGRYYKKLGYPASSY